MAYIDYVGISIDGSPQTQDSQRPLASGKPSSHWVMQTIQALEANHRPYKLRLTTLPPFNHLIEDVRFLCENTRCKRMQVEAAYNTQRGGDYQHELEEGMQFLQAFMAAQKLAEQYGRKLHCVGSEIGKITSVPCGSPFNSLIITPQNNLVACFEVVNTSHPLAELTTIGRITPQGVEIDDGARVRLRQKLIERRDSCRDCFCFWSCAGGCLTRVLSPGPNGHLEHGVHCELKQTLLKEMLLKHIAAGNGLRKGISQFSITGNISKSRNKNH
jgi:radical SAM protein with 4Fe4S-binding SPASM domain